MRHDITPRSYDDLLRQVRFFVPEKNLQATRHGKYTYFTLIGDFRHGTKNFYCTSFKLKTLLPEPCLYKIILLQVLDDGQCLPFSKIAAQVEKILAEHRPALLDADFLQTLRRRLNELLDSGYLVALNQKELLRLRIEKITAVKLTADDAENFSRTQEKLRTIRLRIKFATPQEKFLREKILTDELPCRIVEETADEFICVVETPDPLQIYPRLWKFQPWAEILAGEDGLRDRMRRDVLEALKIYAEPV